MTKRVCTAADYLAALTHMKRLVRAAGKRCYVFVVGKLNAPKLANFQEIELFVLLACAEHSLVDSKEFFRPLITPFELHLALAK